MRRHIFYEHGMTVRGAGLDVCDLTRFDLAVTRSAQPFLRRVFNPEELTDGNSLTLAERFSIKESVIKVIGGLPPRGRYLDISVGAGGDRRSPQVRAGGEVGRRLDALGGRIDTCVQPVSSSAVLTWAVATSHGDHGR